MEVTKQTVDLAGWELLPALAGDLENAAEAVTDAYTDRRPSAVKNAEGLIGLAQETLGAVRECGWGLGYEEAI